MNRTLVLCKPDAVERRLVGEVVRRFETKGLSVVAMRMLTIDAELAGQHYIQRMKRSLEEILSEHTGQTVEKISTDTDRDFVMTAQQAKEYGIIDEVIDTRNVVDTSGAIKAID